MTLTLSYFRSELLEHQKEISAMGALVLSADTSCKLYSDVASSSLIIANLVDKMTGITQVTIEESQEI